ncbi:CU044_5270 family protein [Sphaerisporangium corydalis]|uniref:CU044_5270 family protein n=1 Tax=Sphaerisporangium corydalis TaxID=1441875 RepID=A0ABV9EF26_9ACTN|nr:CU044_5270 family protein [Sphaerisporangium corydalis]
MNSLDQLRAARPAHLDTAPDPATRAAELSYAMAQARPRRSRRISRPVWGLGLAGVATATAVAVAVSGTGGTAPPVAGGTQAAPSTGSAEPSVRLSAKQILLAAAGSALKAPVASGAYWYVESTGGSADQVGTKERYTVHTTSKARFWFARSPRKESWWTSQNLGTKPAEGAEEAWERDGSPTRWSLEVSTPKANGTVPKVRMKLSSDPGKPFGNPINVGDKIRDLAGKNVSMAELQDLPTTAAGLKKRLLSGYEGHGTESDDPQDADSWLFQVTSGLLDGPVKPEVRAAAYKVLAGLGGVRALGEVTDVLGRTGQGVARTENWATGRFERQIIIDPETGLPLSDQVVAIKGKGSFAWAEPGTPVFWQATEKATWTDAPPVKP